MDMFSVGIAVSILLYVLVGNYAGRKVKGLDDYFVAGRRSPTLLIVGTLVASFLSTNAFLGETGFAYEGYGFLLLVLIAINTTGYVVGALFFGRFVRRSGALTLPEYFGRRFNSRRVQVVTGITIVVGLAAYLLAVTQGASLIISEVVDIPYGLTLLIVWLGYTLFTLYSGSQGVVITDTLMFLLFTVVAFLALPYIVDGSGGWFDTIQALATYEAKPDIIAWHGVNGDGAYWSTPGEALIWALILGVSWATVLAVSPWQTSRYLMARNEHTVIRSACISGGILMLLYIALVVSGAAINLDNPNIETSNKAIIWAAMNMMPTWLGVLLMAGLMAAALSSASTFLSLIGFSVSHDIVRFKGRTDASSLRITRWTMLVVGLIVLVLAYAQPPAVMWITYFAGTLFASSWGPVAFMSIWSRHITEAAAFWGILAGFIGNIAAKLLSKFGVLELPVYLDPFIVGLVLSIATIMLISRMTRVSQQESDYRLQIHRTPASEFDAGELRQTLVWSKALMVLGVATSVFLVVMYALPYGNAVGG
ncbi:sodium:solute symporter family protein [Oceanimonas doudoroffii]|uniref:Sodium:solute symporter n=1 Tax=Oceanimonas doudoroffii TaxID=84158 RepID=A0A233RGV0_9GAMM|nr:sodium:solute symporter family protein [Oceanimonas doudoroffii]OXY82626.1 sodium:solute symporter [Oceanimonas doudoroffii]